MKYWVNELTLKKQIFKIHVYTDLYYTFNQKYSVIFNKIKDTK